MSPVETVFVLEIPFSQLSNFEVFACAYGLSCCPNGAKGNMTLWYMKPPFLGNWSADMMSLLRTEAGIIAHEITPGCPYEKKFHDEKSELKWTVGLM